MTGRRAVLFDMDGVLVDSEPVIEAAARTGLAEYGVKAEPEDFIPFVGTGEDSYIGGVARKYGLEYKPEMKKRVYEIYLQIVKFQLGIYEGVTGMLQALKDDGWLLAVASSADRIKINANLEAAGIPDSLFSAIISGEDVERKKPWPDIYLKAADCVEVPSENCVVVEDSLSGIKAAKAAGMKCIAVSTSFSRERLKEENPDHICSRTADVRNAIKNL